ncbi:MAG: hypothetical protein LUC94_12565, partial [Clostridiales bacterium]|nr:hypothetical protein [Clostridiales bacterium]
ICLIEYLFLYIRDKITKFRRWMVHRYDVCVRQLLSSREGRTCYRNGTESRKEQNLPVKPG